MGGARLCPPYDSRIWSKPHIMSTYRLDKLLRPQSAAVIGASPRATSPGHAVLRNLSAAGFPGPIGLVNPHYDAIAGIPAVKSFDALAHLPDLVVIAAPPSAVPSLVSTAGQAGSSAAVIITAGLGHGRGSLAEACAQAARASGLRLVGPNCLGVLAPYAKLNASFAASMPRSGDLALISQSGAIAAGLVEWASPRAHRLFRRGLARRPDRRRLRRSARLLRARSAHARHPALRRIGQRRAQVHVGGARGGANQSRSWSSSRAGMRRAPKRRRPIPAHSPDRMRSMTPHFGAPACLRVLDLDELFAAAETLGRSTAVRRQAARHSHQWRRNRRARGRSPGGSSAARSPSISPTRWRGSMRRCRRSGREQIRSILPAMPMRARYAAAFDALLGRSRQRRHPGDERPDRARLGDRGGTGRCRVGASASHRRSPA